MGFEIRDSTFEIYIPVVCYEKRWTVNLKVIHFLYKKKTVILIYEENSWE